MLCTATIQIPLHEFAEIDRATNRFLVVPGHELPEVEDVVERGDRFLIVGKRELGRILSNAAPISRAESNSATSVLPRPRSKEPPPTRSPWGEPGIGARTSSATSARSGLQVRSSLQLVRGGRRTAQVTPLLASPSLRSSSSGTSSSISGKS
jgi:hypothetical protein